MTDDEAEKVWHSRKVLMIAAVCLIVLAFLGTAVTAVFVVEQRGYNDCQRGHNDAIQAALRERGTAGDLDRKAIRLSTSSSVAMIDALLTPGSTQEQRVMAIQRWREAQHMADGMLEDADNQRKANPLPGPRQC